MVAVQGSAAPQCVQAADPCGLKPPHVGHFGIGVDVPRVGEFRVPGRAERGGRQPVPSVIPEETPGVCCDPSVTPVHFGRCT